MRTALYVLLALAAVPAFAGQTVYKWVDEKGVTHFSDQPVAGAEKVELSGGSNRSSNPAPTYSPPAREETPTQKGPSYSRFVIASPQQDEAIINTGGVVRVSLAATPAIASGHVVTLYLDGNRVQDFGAMALDHEFKEMPRGTHTVRAVVSYQGKVLQETPTVTFHVRQESAAQPPVGPALRNNNKPKRSAGNKLITQQPSYAALNGGKAPIDPRTNRPIVSKPKPKPTNPKAPPSNPKAPPTDPKAGK